jgi:quinol monooxygenase YgiN
MDNAHKSHPTNPGGEHMFGRAISALMLCAVLVIVPSQRVTAEPIAGQFVLVVELEIDPAHLEQFKAAIKENGEAAVREEPGCRSFNAVFEKDNPTRVRLLEVYDNADAFKAHQESAHFKKYDATTKNMVKSRKRIDNIPITLNVKGK